MITYLEPDNAAVEVSHLGNWRVFNGQYWTHGFVDRGRAITFAEKNGGVAVGKAYLNKETNKVCYKQVTKVGTLTTI